MDASNAERTRLAPGQAARVLSAHGITPTPQRLRIAAVMLACDQHFSADGLMAIVNREGPGVAKATVYNTLALFARVGLVREVIVHPSKVFYDSNTAPHHHFYDLDTGELTDIAEEEIAISQLPPAPSGTELQAIDVIVRVKKPE